ncbi:MAG: hypothetical protein EZS28_036585, partial [Streblomastix strix]
LSTTILHVIGVRNGSDDKTILAGAATDSIIQTIFSPDENASKSGSKALCDLIEENEIIRHQLMTTGFIQKDWFNFTHSSYFIFLFVDATRCQPLFIDNPLSNPDRPTFSIIPLVRSIISLGNSLLISISPRIAIRILGGSEVRQGDTGITNHYPVSEGDEDNNWLHPSHLISPLYCDIQFNLSLSWPELLVNHLAISFALIDDAKIQYC